MLPDPGSTGGDIDAGNTQTSWSKGATPGPPPQFSVAIPGLAGFGGAHTLDRHPTSGGRYLLSLSTLTHNGRLSPLLEV